MGCIQSKKIVKIGSHSSKEDSKNESNNIAIHNIRKDTTNDNDNSKNNNSKKETNVKTDERVVHSNSQIFKVKAPINDDQLKSIHSKKIVVFSMIVIIVKKIQKNLKYIN